MARAAQIEQVAVQSIALNLTSVLAPYRKHGRLSLRVERLPQNARLSRGTRNNDATWSLASDELEDLCVLTPEAFKKDINLGVRIISLINGNTLTTLELPIRPGDEAAVAKTPAMPSPAEIAELNVLRKELAAAKDALSARDSELAERLAAAATDTSNQFEQTLAKAEAAWTDAENGRLASVQQQWQEKFAEALTEIDGAKVEAHEAQVRDLEEKIAVLQASLDQGSVALTEAKAADAAAREHGHSATQDALKKLAELQTKLADREADLLRAVASSDATKRDAEAALAKAEQAWRDGEAQRLAAAEAHWREVSDKALSDARANSETLLTKGGASERDLLNRVAELQAAITERDEALARTNAANEQARAHAAHETEVQLARAADTWKSAEAARLAKVEADWRAKLDDAAKAVVADAPIMPVPTANEAELQALRDKTNSLQAKLTLRDAAAARAAKLSDEERRRWQKEAQDVIVKAARERKSDENARFAAAQADWTKQSVRELALASARAEAAEAALAQLRIRASEEAPLQREVVSLRSALAIREAELEHYRGAEPSHGEPVRTADPIVETQTTNPRANRMYRDALIAACVGVVAVILWPTISNLIQSPPPAPPKPPAAVVVAPPQAALPVALAAKGANLRATPSPYGKITGKVPRDSRVEVVEVKGDWTRVHLAGVPAKSEPAEGWAKSSLLQEVPAAPAKPAKPAKKK